MLRFMSYMAKSAINLLNPIHTITLCILRIHFNVVSYNVNNNNFEQLQLNAIMPDAECMDS